MTQRLDYNAVTPAGVKALGGVYGHILQSDLPQPLIELVYLRISQINGCAYCIDMHWKDARATGESEQRLYGLDARREAPYYTDRERAALEWTEALTNITDGHVPDGVYDAVRGPFFYEPPYFPGYRDVWGHVAVARTAFRDPISTLIPATAQRRDSPRPCGPVPPSTPTVRSVTSVNSCPFPHTRTAPDASADPPPPAEP